MSEATQNLESEGIAERRAQRVLTERVGIPLVRRDRSTNLSWSTWKWRLGGRGKTRTAA
jgi:hypothetical protein